MAARWDGNVRELRNVIERACILADSELITERELFRHRPPPAAPPARLAPPPADDGDGPLSELERDHIVRVMESVGGNKMSAARILGIGRRALYRRLERYGIGTIERRQKSKD
jgi:DNA-binding NtrC family response regulator